MSAVTNEKSALDWLYGTQLFGVKLGLDNTHRLLRALDLPPPGQRFIHVAGTNGKGSTCAFMHSILKEAGVRAGLFTSPHLIEFRERIRDANRLISSAEVSDGITRLRAIVSDWDPHPTFFELTFALAMDWFRMRRLDWVILETGMGGRLDATNAITPAVSVITPIGFDHTQILGHTLGEIAFEKAGIIKPGVPVVSAPQEPEALRVIERAAAEKGSRLVVVDEVLNALLGLAGRHQSWNAAVAVRALQESGLVFSEQTIRDGLRKTEWPARFQRLDPNTILDGAHNPPAARELAESWQHEFGDAKAAIIFGGSTGKDTAAILRELAPVAARWILTGFDSPRAMAPESVKAKLLAAMPGTASDAVFCASTIGEAIDIASRFPERRLITGSLFFAGDVLAHIGTRTGRREMSDQ